jgi:two-component system, sensor histidine kinase PdtaS
MPKIPKNKDQISATVSPWIKKQCLEMAQGPDFTSVSDIVSQALSEFIAKYNEKKTKETKKHEENVSEILICALMQTKSGQEWLESVYNSNPKLFCENEESENSKNSKLLEMMKTKFTSRMENPSTE